MCVNVEFPCGNSHVASTSECSASCPQGMFNNSGVCVFECPKYYADGTCYDECPNSTYLSGRECISECKDHVVKRGNTLVCVPCTKDAGFGVHMNGVCVSDCRSSALYKFLSADGTECLVTCPDKSEDGAIPFMYDLDTRQCLASNTCPLYVAPKGVIVCVKKCPKNLPYVKMGQCVDKCGDGYSALDTTSEKDGK